jgi:DNA topoisomerase-1
LSPGAVTLQEALQLLALPRELGEHSSLPGGPITASAGRFGPYVQWGGVSAALPKELHPLDVSLEAAVELVLKKREKLLAKGQAPEDLAPKAASAASARGGAGGRKGRRATSGKAVKGSKGAGVSANADLAASTDNAGAAADDDGSKPLGRNRRKPKAQQPEAEACKKVRAPSAYLLFCKQRREELKAAGVQASPQDVMKMLAAEWRARGAASDDSD